MNQAGGPRCFLNSTPGATLGTVLCNPPGLCYKGIHADSESPGWATIHRVKGANSWAQRPLQITYAPAIEQAYWMERKTVRRVSSYSIKPCKMQLGSLYDGTPLRARPSLSPIFLLAAVIDHFRSQSLSVSLPLPALRSVRCSGGCLQRFHWPCYHMPGYIGRGYVAPRRDGSAASCGPGRFEKIACLGEHVKLSVRGLCNALDDLGQDEGSLWKLQAWDPSSFCRGNHTTAGTVIIELRDRTFLIAECRDWVVIRDRMVIDSRGDCNAGDGW
jgi:hypothetical protein